jgi:hypothetical protein
VKKKRLQRLAARATTSTKGYEVSTATPAKFYLMHVTILPFTVHLRANATRETSIRRTGRCIIGTD